MDTQNLELKQKNALSLIFTTFFVIVDRFGVLKDNEIKLRNAIEKKQMKY